MAAGSLSPTSWLVPNVELTVSLHDAHQRDVDDDAAARLAVEAALTMLTIDATSEPTPTLLFRVALSLRRDGYADQADAFFRQSSRMLSEQYVNGRLRLRRPHVA